VSITLYPERLLAYTDAKDNMKVAADIGKDVTRRRLLERLVEERGLRAQLKSGSLVTGQLYVAFEYFPNAPKAKVDWKAESPELPVVPSDLLEIEAKVNSILDKIDRLPLDAVGAALKKDLESLDLAIADARKLMGSADTLVVNVDGKIVPSLKANLEALQPVLQAAEQAMKNVDATLLGPNAPAQQELRDALTEFTRAARSLRVLLDYLERHPESPIRGKSQSSSGGK
jgi:paraquat-inducible protein B